MQLLVGGILGHAVCLRAVAEDTPSLIVIGLFYGLVTYIVSRMALRWLNPAVFAVWRTWPVFVGQLLFGATLAVFAAFVILCAASCQAALVLVGVHNTRARGSTCLDAVLVPDR